MAESRVGLFLGAGASYEAGMPLVNDLTKELRDLLKAENIIALNDDWRNQGEGVSDEVIQDFISIISRSDMHYESILGYIETQQARQHSLTQDYGAIYSWLIGVVYHLLYCKHISRKQYMLNQLDFYKGINFLYEKNNPLWVFSLNHDCLIEMLARKFGIPLYCGFSSEVVRLPVRDSAGSVIGSICAETLKRDVIDNSAMYFPNPPAKGLYLLKLHGSLDVFTFNDGEDLLRVLPDSDTPDSVIDILRVANEGLIYLDDQAPDGKLKISNEIVYADDVGEMQFLRRTLLSGAKKFSENSQQVLPKSMIKHFESNINFISDLKVIGYGFGDHHVNEVLKSWLEFSSSRTLEIVSPRADSVPAFLLHVAPQVKFVASGATEYLDAISGIQRTDLEKVGKEISRISLAMGAERTKSVFDRFQDAEVKLAADKLAAAIEKFGLDHLEGASDCEQDSSKLEISKRFLELLKDASK